MVVSLYQIVAGLYLIASVAAAAEAEAAAVSYIQYWNR